MWLKVQNVSDAKGVSTQNGLARDDEGVLVRGKPKTANVGCCMRGVKVEPSGYGSCLKVGPRGGRANLLVTSTSKYQV